MVARGDDEERSGNAEQGMKEDLWDKEGQTEGPFIASALACGLKALLKVVS